MSTKGMQQGNLEKALLEFTPKQRKMLFENLGSIELTKGCSGRCNDCGAGALRGVRSYISHEDFKNILEKYKKQIDKSENYFLFTASDPFDYDFNGKTYEDMHLLYSKIIETRPWVTTSAPKGSEDRILAYILDNKDNFKEKRISIDQLSVMDSNYPRLNKALLQIEGFKSENQFIIDRSDIEKISDERVHLKEDKLKELGLYDNYAKIYVGGKTDNLGKVHLVKINPYNAVVSIGKPVEFKELIKMYHTKREESARNPFTYGASGIIIYDFHSGSIRSRLNLGASFNEYELSSRGVGCFHGVVMHPEGFDNLQIVRPSREFPQGLVRKRITSKNFEIVPVKRMNVDNHSTSYYERFLKKGKRRINDKTNLIKKMLVA